MALAETAQLVVELNLRGNLTQGARKAQGALRSLDAATARTQRSMGRAARSFALLGAGAIAGGAAALKWAGDFEAGLNTINTVAGVTPDRLQAIGKDILALSRRTGTGVEDLQAAYYDLVSAGVDAADAQTVLTQANKLAIGGLSTTSEAVDLLTTAINSYGVDAKQAGKITDYFAQAIAAGKTTAAALASTFARVAPLASKYGIGIDELAASYGQMTAGGVEASEVATDIRAAITALQKPSEGLLLVQKKTRINFARMAKDKGLAYAYNRLDKEADKMGMSLFDVLGRQEAVTYALYSTGDAYRDYQTQLRLVRKAHDGIGVSQEQYDERQKGMNRSLTRLKAIAKSTGIVLLTGLLPGVTKVANKIGKLVEEHQPDIERFGTKLGKLVDKLFTDENVESAVEGALTFLKDLPWGVIGDGLKITADATKSIIDGFKSLPPDMQKLAIAALAINKVGGGIVTSGIRDIGALFLKSLTTINAAHVTVIGASVGGAGTPPVVGGPKGPGLLSAPVLLPFTIASLATNAAIGALIPVTKKSQDLTKELERASGSAGLFTDMTALLTTSVSDGLTEIGRAIGTVKRITPHTGTGPGGAPNQGRGFGGASAGSGDRSNRPQNGPASDGPQPSRGVIEPLQSIDRKTGETARSVNGIKVFEAEQGVRAIAAIAQVKAATDQARTTTAARIAASQATEVGQQVQTRARIDALKAGTQATLAGVGARVTGAVAGASSNIAGAVRTSRPIVRVYPAMTTVISATAVAGGLVRATSTNRVRVE